MSKYGATHGLQGYDAFRTGLTYYDVYMMLATSSKHSHRRRNSVLGFWHELKLQLYEQAVNCGYPNSKGEPDALSSMWAEYRARTATMA